MGGQQRFDVRRDLSELLGVTGGVVLVEVAVVDDHGHAVSLGGTVPPSPESIATTVET
jgi:hypothetical protein